MLKCTDHIALVCMFILTDHLAIGCMLRLADHIAPGCILKSHVAVGGILESANEVDWMHFEVDRPACELMHFEVARPLRMETS